jgi:GT2 family glycosyltransferase
MAELSIIVVSYETRDVLRECLASIATHAPSCPHEVIVVDNASSDGSVAMVRDEFPQATLIENAVNVGFGRANNQGVALAAGGILLFQNSDCLATAGLYDGALARFAGEPRLGILGPLLTGRDGELLQMSWGWTPSILGEVRQKRYTPRTVQASARVRARVARLQQHPRDVGLVAGACMFARRSAFEEIGGFDEGIVFYFEEPDLCLRARRAGWRVVFEPGIRAVHLLGVSSGDGLTRATQIYRQSQVHYYRTHFGWLQNALLRLYLELKFRCQCARAGDAAARRHYQEILEIIRGQRVVDFVSSRPIAAPAGEGSRSS